MPKASIIIITKNQKRYLEKSLPQIFNQRERDFEVIVVDSGSTDGARELFQKYPMKIIDFDRKKFNYSRAFNLGAKEASGKYLIRLSGDAIPADEFWLENLISELELNQNLAGIFSKWLNYKGNLNLVDQFLVWFCMEKEKIYFEKAPNWLGTSGSLRRELWQKYPFDESLPRCEDMDWSIKVQQEGFKILYEPSSRVYHSHNEGLVRFFKRGIWTIFALLIILKRKVVGHYKKSFNGGVSGL